MQQKMFKVMWATMALSLVAFCANPVLAQDENLQANDSSTEVLTTTDKTGTADFDGGVVDCDARSDCQKAEQAVADAKRVLKAANDNYDNLYKAQQDAANELGALLDRTPPASEAEVNAVAEKGVLAANASRNAKTLVDLSETALESANTNQKAACAERGPRYLPNPEVPERNPTVTTMPSPDFQSDAEFGQFAVQGSSANSG